MQCNLLHNKIIKDTVSSAFIDGIQNDLLPRIESLYGDELKGVLMYEDHLADGFSYEGEWYYPLTLMTSGADEIFWVKWSVEKTKNFRNGNPYSYVGKEPLEFYIADEVPEQFKSAMEGRAINYDRDSLPIQIYANDADPSLLVGKYSQSFVDEMARQLTDEISSAMSVVGLPESNMEFQLVFTPETYMQHTSENVTYRRLLITDYGCQARDFWVKWTRLDGVVGYSISDHVTAENIKFELGEDVPQKVREKEYRFLCRVNPDKYQSSMGKKTVTEWRELIKRSVKRGDLTKIISDVEIADHASDLSDKLREVLSNHGVAVSGAPVAEQNDGFDEKIADMARAVTEEKETSAEVYEEELQLSEEPSEEEREVLAEEAALEADAESDVSDVTDESEEEELCEEVVEEENEIEEPVIEAEDKGDFIFTPGFQPFEEIEVEDAQTAEETVLEDERFTLPEIELTDAAEPVAEEDACAVEETEELESAVLEAVEDEKGEDAEIEVEIEMLEETVEEETEEAEAEAEAEEVCEIQDNSEEIKQLRDDFAKAEMEAKARIEYEIAAREKAEKEAMLLRLESERLKAENERLIAEAKKLEEERLLAERKREEEERAKAEAEAQRIREEAEYRARVEEQARRDAEERARLAEAARVAVEEQRRIEAERREREIKEREEREERDRERILREEEERRAEARRLEEERRAFEEEQKKAQEAPPVQYMTKHARLIFGRNVDLNVIKRIKEIVEETLVACRKEHVHIHIKAYPIDSYTIHLDVAKIPVTESELLVSIVKAIGNGRIGVTKIFLE